MKFLMPASVAAVLLLILACDEGAPALAGTSSKNESSMILTTAKKSPGLPDWAVSANIYEVNIRQYTPEGTFAAFSEHLPRLKAMGVDIIWLMPVFPVSTTKKKGVLGSFYAVSDFLKLNPAFGTESDFVALVEQTHRLGMKVILDWVPNHTGWDHHWIGEHPDWYTREAATDTIVHPRGEDGKPTDWYDVADLNYDHPELRREMLRCLEYWISEYDIDGYRMDMAMLVPADFWEVASSRLRQMKEIFLLAESEHPVHRNNGYFNADYSWTFHHLMNDIASGKKRADALVDYFVQDNQRYTKGFHMNFTSNHDENAWAGTVFERMGEGHQAFAVLAATVDGIPLLYGGQEAPLRKRLKFFDKDEIDWNGYEYADFYRTLYELKKRNKALWNGASGGDMYRLPTGTRDIFAFSREKDGNRALVFINFSELPQEMKFVTSALVGDYRDVFANSTVSLTSEASMNLKPWGFLVLSNK